MIKTNTVWRAVCTLAIVCAFASTATPQSVLNFTPAGPAGIAVTNTTPWTADIKFTLYNPDGTAASGVNNNRSYRIPASGQLAVMTSEIFPAARTNGWIQATSAVTGLQGFYFSGDLTNSLDGAEAPSPVREQTIAYVPSSPGTQTMILITNPGSRSVDVNVSFYDETGRLVPDGSLSAPSLAPHAQASFPSMGATARITASSGGAVLATAIEESATSLMHIHGQPSDTQAGRWVVPYFKNGDGVTSSLVLANPSQTSPASATVSFLNNNGERVFVSSQPFSIRPNGSTRVTWGAIAGSLASDAGEGWLLVESAQPLTGVALITNGGSTTAIPLQSSGADRILLSRAVTKGMLTRVTLVGDSERDANLKLTLSRPDGTTAAQSDYALPARARVSLPLDEIVPSVEDFDGGYFTIRSERSIPVFSLGLMDLSDGLSEAVVVPQRLSPAFNPGPASGTPRIVKATLTDADGVLRPGARLKVETQNVQVSDTPALLVGSQSIVMDSASGGVFTANLPPNLDPGLVKVRLRSVGMDSNVQTLGVYSADGSLGADSRVLRGQAFFQKVEVTDNGLDTSLTSLFPVRNARVEIYDPVRQGAVVVSETDESGSFEIPVPSVSGLKVRVLSQLRSQDMKVLNNAANNIPYSIEAFIDGLQSSTVQLIDTTRAAGAFNILDALQKGNTLIMNAAPGLTPPALTVYWSEKNDAATIAKLTNGAIRTTFFNPITNSAYILGDRNIDSDEFDDSVILHEYAHLLAAKFSRDDSNGGIHLLGDSLDPRIAWSEGWANFFSSAARGSSIYRDSKAPGSVLRFDLEENVPAGDHPGYSSEASVGGLLWDLIDENADKDDTAQFPFASVWSAFTDLKADRNVYLPYFLEHFLQRNPGFSDGLRTMVVARSIDFQPDVRPSVTNPFPRVITIGGSQSGQVDSLTTKRTNLSNSSHFFSLSTTTGGQVSITLRIENAMPANNPSANDLDLFLYDSTGKRIIAQSDEPTNGGVEIIPATLAPGTYFIEVRSFYIANGTNATVFNSGSYKLSVDRF